MEQIINSLNLSFQEHNKNLSSNSELIEACKELLVEANIDIRREESSKYSATDLADYRNVFKNLAQFDLNGEGQMVL